MPHSMPHYAPLQVTLSWAPAARSLDLSVGAYMPACLQVSERASRHMQELMNVVHAGDDVSDRDLDNPYVHEE